MDTDTTFMRAAIKQAQKAYEKSEVPIGCVIVHDGKIIARGYNRRNTDKSTLAHAEITAIRKAAKKLGDWRLEDCTLYVTLEPCPMCAGAAINARLDNVYFGAYDKNSGCAKSAVDLFSMNLLSHKINCEGGILEDECRGLLQSFFKKLRSR